MIDLAELKIYGLNERWGDADSGADALELMREVYNTVLKPDPMWHFFWEGDYTVIRCTKILAGDVDEYFSAFDNFTVIWKQDGYRENIRTTKKYLEGFVSIFHGFSVIAMAMDDEDLVDILERINHCFLNMVTNDNLKEKFLIQSNYELDGAMSWEAVVISQVALARMFTSGWLTGLSNKRKRAVKYGEQKN